MSPECLLVQSPSSCAAAAAARSKVRSPRHCVTVVAAERQCAVSTGQLSPGIAQTDLPICSRLGAVPTRCGGGAGVYVCRRYDHG